MLGVGQNCDATMFNPGQTGMENDNRRKARRFTVSATVEIFHKGYSIEFPTRDISSSGAGVVACGVDHLAPGDKVLVVLSPELEVNAVIVKANPDMVHLAFDPAMQGEVEDYLKEAHGLLGA